MRGNLSAYLLDSILYVISIVLQILAYVEGIYDIMLKTPRKKLEEIEEELKKETPEPLHMMLSEKQAKNDAIGIFCSRKRKINIDIPPTCNGNNLECY